MLHSEFLAVRLWPKADPHFGDFRDAGTSALEKSGH